MSIIPSKASAQCKPIGFLPSLAEECPGNTLGLNTLGDADES